MKKGFVQKVVKPSKEADSDFEDSLESHSSQDSPKPQRATKLSKTHAKRSVYDPQAKPGKKKPELNQNLIDAEDSEEEVESDSASQEEEEDSVEEPVKIVTKRFANLKKEPERAKKLDKKAHKKSTAQAPEIVQAAIEIEHSTFLVEAKPVSKLRALEFLYYFISLITFGVSNLLNHWLKDSLFVWFVFRRIEALDRASHVELVHLDGSRVHRPLFRRRVFVSADFDFEAVLFEHNYTVFFLNEETGTFQDLWRVVEGRLDGSAVSELAGGRLETEVPLVRAAFGSNSMRIALKPLVERLRELLFSPTAVFAIVAALFLHVNGFCAFAGLLLAILAVHLWNQFSDSVVAETKLAESLNFGEKVIVVRRSADGVFKKKIADSSDLVLGDLIEITNNLLVPADVALTHGSCVLREEFGDESANVRTKIAVGQLGVQSLCDERALLPAGGQVVYTVANMSEGCFGVVVRTGFGTARGKALRKGLEAAAPAGSTRWEAALLYSFFALALVAGLSFVLHQKLVLHRKALNFRQVFEGVVELFLVVLNPLIPFAFSWMLKQSFDRLKRHGVDTHDPSRLRAAGRIRNVLLERNVAVLKQKSTAGLILSSSNGTDSPALERFCGSTKKFFKTLAGNENAVRFSEAFGLCNMVTKVGEDLFGSEVEIELLKNSAFELRYPLQQGKMAAERIFTPRAELAAFFESEYKARRILVSAAAARGGAHSVIVETSRGGHFLYSRFDPGDIERLCTKQSIPYNYHSCVSKYCNKGLKVVGFAFRPLTPEQLDQPAEAVEAGLTFLGFYFVNTTVNENCIETIAVLKGSNIGLTLASDSSVHLAIAVARRSELISADDKVLLGRTERLNNVEKLHWTLFEPKLGLLNISHNQSSINAGEGSLLGEHMNVTELESPSDFEHLESIETVALTGAAYNFILETGSDELKAKILPRCRIFGNLAAEDRRRVIEGLQQSGPVAYIFKRNGNMDAIARADVSLALQPRAGLSGQTFSSRAASLGVFTQLVEEGRSAAANLEQSIYFIIFFTALQLAGFGLLAARGAAFSQCQILFLDFFVFFAFSVLQAELKSVRLNKHVPDSRLLTLKFGLKAGSMALLGIGALYFVVWALWKTRFYRTPAQLAKDAPKAAGAETLFAYDPFCVFIGQLFICLAVVMTSNKGNFFKRGLFTKFGLSFYWGVVFAFGICLLLIHKSKLTLFGASRFLVQGFAIPDLFGFEVIVLLMLPLIFGAVLFGDFLRARLYKFVSKRLALAGSRADGHDEDAEADFIGACKNKSLLNDSKVERKTKQTGQKKGAVKVKRAKLVKKDKAASGKSLSRVENSQSVCRGEKKEGRVKGTKRQKSD